MTEQPLERWKDQVLEALGKRSLWGRVGTRVGSASSRPRKESSCDLGKEVNFVLWTWFTFVG